MKVFISHNKADKSSARALAELLIKQGINVWFDEWDIGPGESIVGGIEQGITDANVFVLLWSAKANASNWVDIEVKAFLRRRVENEGLKIVPLMIDSTQLPALVADYRGFDLSSGTSLEEVVIELTGNPRDVEVARRLQTELLELTGSLASTGDPLPYFVCPSCASTELKRGQFIDEQQDDIYYIIECKKCRWSDCTQ